MYFTHFPDNKSLQNTLFFICLLCFVFFSLCERLKKKREQLSKTTKLSAQFWFFFSVEEHLVLFFLYIPPRDSSLKLDGYHNHIQYTNITIKHNYLNDGMCSQCKVIFPLITTPEEQFFQATAVYGQMLMYYGH